MNYCRLTAKLDLTKQEIYALFSSPEADYFDLETKTWSAEPTPSSLAVKSIEARVGILPLNPKDFDEYTNQITMMSWQELKEYLLRNPEIINVWQAAFILDIAERNAISLNEKYLEYIKTFRCLETLTPFHRTGKKGYSAFDLFEARNKEVFQYLNLVVIDDAFVRV